MFFLVQQFLKKSFSGTEISEKKILVQQFLKNVFSCTAISEESFSATAISEKSYPASRFGITNFLEQSFCHHKLKEGLA